MAHKNRQTLIVVAAADPSSLLEMIAFIGKISNDLLNADIEKFKTDPKVIAWDSSHESFMATQWDELFLEVNGYKYMDGVAATVDNAYYGDYKHYQKMRVHPDCTEEYVYQQTRKYRVCNGWQIFFPKAQEWVERRNAS